MSANLELEGLSLQVQSTGLDTLKKAYWLCAKNPQASSELSFELVSLILDYAKKIITHPARPTIRKLETLDMCPDGELAVDETFDENPLVEHPHEIWMDKSVERPFRCVTLLDSSASMAGEKHLLASIAVAVWLLRVPVESTSLLLFGSNAKVVKPFRSRESHELTLLRFLKSTPKGFTNIANGLDEGLKQLALSSHSRRKVGLIVTDGRTTEGADPGDFARCYDYLVVLHLHGPGSHLAASKMLAEKGHGMCLEVERFEDLPRRMYDAIRLLGRM